MTIIADRFFTRSIGLSLLAPPRTTLRLLAKLKTVESAPLIPQNAALAALRWNQVETRPRERPPQQDSFVVHILRSEDYFRIADDPPTIRLANIRALSITVNHGPIDCI